MRKHKKPHEWRELVVAQQNSELSVLAFWRFGVLQAASAINQCVL